MMIKSELMVMAMVLLVVLSGVGSGVDEGYYPPATACYGTSLATHPRNSPLPCSNCGPSPPQTSRNHH